jgi:putative ABC transport system permease protein
MTSSGWHPTLLRREAGSGAAQLSLFAVCVILAAIAVSVVAGWRASVDAAMASENKKGAGGDVVVFSTEPFSPEVVQAAEPYQRVRTTEMFTVALAPGTDLSLFSKLKAVEPGYPLYGELPLASGRDPHQVLSEGLIVEQRVLERLGLKIGDELKVGTRVFTVADVALSEPDRPLGMFGVSPRIFINLDQLHSTGLERPGSYLERRIHIKLPDPAQAETVAGILRQAAVPDQERVETWERPPVNMERFVGNFFTFLDMMAVLATALGGLGMQSTLSTWLANRRRSIAVMKTLGANRAFILRHYSLLVGAITVLALGLGLLVGGGLLQASGDYLSTMLPVRVQPSLSFFSAAQAAMLCLVVAAAFSLWPLLEASGVKPGAILRQEVTKVSWRTKTRQLVLTVGTLYALLATLTQNPLRAAKITLGLTIVLGLSALFASQTVRSARRSRPSSLALRTALGTWRDPASKTTSVVFVLGTCLTILFTAGIIERALRQSWLSAMPADVPNLLFLDIQPGQWEEFERFVGLPMEVTSTMRVRAQAVDGIKIDRSAKREYWERDARREFDASPTTKLPVNDYLVAGESLFDGDSPNQVSLRDDVAEALEAGVGQEVEFTIQGVPVKAKVSSVRHSEREGFRPRFELLFPPALVEGAPQTMYARLRLDEDRVGPLQTRVAKAYPSVVSMDVSLTIRLVGERLFQMVGLVRYFLLAGLLAGATILISAAWSARWERLRESAYLKILGANRSFVHKVLLYENLALGGLCSSLSFVLAVVISWGLCRWTLEVPFPDLSDLLAVMLLLPTAVISGLGWLLSRGVVSAKPAPFLREGAE